MGIGYRKKRGRVDFDEKCLHLVKILSALRELPTYFRVLTRSEWKIQKRDAWKRFNTGIVYKMWSR